MGTEEFESGEGEAARLVLESGAVFYGRLMGSPPPSSGVWGEVVFNTCMTGYQEIASDPSYAGQIVVMTYPLIGNYGCNDSFMESSRFHCRGLIVRQLSPTSGHPGSPTTLDAELRRQGVTGLTGIDTRALTRHIRSKGALRGVIGISATMTISDQLKAALEAPSIESQDLVGSLGSTSSGSDAWKEGLPTELGSGLDRQRGKGLRIVCLDLGIKRNQLRALTSRGANVFVVDHGATLDAILGHKPDGVLVSNGPGDPARLNETVELVRQLVKRGIPVLGICLGHQILGRVAGASTSKLRFGHHGGNHPVREVSSGKVFITAQNHEFQVDAESLPVGSNWFVSERNVNDDSVEGLRHRTLPAFSVQYHPEGAPGPRDRAGVFDEFLDMCRSLQPSELQPSTSLFSVTKPPLRSVLVIGSGPVVIGQAAEFDYAGTQACRSLREEGVRVILVNSNPATIMTDDDSADAVYVEPLTVPVLERIIAKEQPEGLLATLGGQTGLNLAVALGEAGVLDKYGVQVLGTSLEAIQMAEDRERFKELLQRIGQPVPLSETVSTVERAMEFLKRVGLPAVVRPAFTLGGTGGGLCDTAGEFATTVRAGLAASPISQVLIERSLKGWRELEYEVMRDSSGTCITICNMENIDPMGVHTGDSIVVAPSQTLTDREHQQLRTAALAIIEALGIQGGCNVQFALAPDTHEYYVIEVNPRVSRSSALASKATGYPIARVAAKIALGKRLDEIPNAVTGKTTAAFEPALDYCVIKIPRWPFDKFPKADRRLGTQMKSTGEVMAIGRTFEAALNKALRSLEQPEPPAHDLNDPALIATSNDRRLYAIREQLRKGGSIKDLAAKSGIAAWFIERVAEIVRIEESLSKGTLTHLELIQAKQAGLSDDRIASLSGMARDAVSQLRARIGLKPTFKCVDTCAAEFEATTPYYYSSFETEDEAFRSEVQPVIVVGSGPIRIGQGIEFDYCAVQAAESLRRLGIEAVMVNSNPETVSTDFDCSSRLYFEPLDAESVSAIVESESARGVMAQFGGQTAINLVDPLAKMGIRILGTSVDSIDLAEDRSRFEAFLRRLDIPQPPGAATVDPREATVIADEIGYPVLVRPSFVLGGRGMEIVYRREDLMAYMDVAIAALPKENMGRRGRVLIDKYLVGSEIDVDVISDGETVVIPGLMEHIEAAGVHSGDSMAVYPPHALKPVVEAEIIRHTERIARALGVQGLCNIQFVVSRDRPYVIEVNPRSSRTVPFLSKVTGVPMVDLATQASLGRRLSEPYAGSGLVPAKALFAVKAPVFSTVKLAEVDTALGPEMKSTGEVMGIDRHFTAAVEKAFLSVLGKLPTPDSGVLCSLADVDKGRMIPIASRLQDLGFALYATEGTAHALSLAGLIATTVAKIADPSTASTVLDVINSGDIGLVINTVSRSAKGITASGRGEDDASGAVRDGFQIRRAADECRIPCCTSLDTAMALVSALERAQSGESFEVARVQDYRAAPGAIERVPA